MLACDLIVRRPGEQQLLLASTLDLRTVNLAKCLMCLAVQSSQAEQTEWLKGISLLVD